MDQLLSMSLKQLGEIEIVKGAKIPQRQTDIPAVVRIITAEQIKVRGYMSLEEALSDLPGFQFRDIQGFNTYSFIRGAPNQNNLTLLLIDGIPINELNSGGFYGGLQHNLANIKRIEVSYGPASALYGTNAISGTINLITFNPDDKAAQGAYVSVTAGSFDTRNIDFRTASYDEEQQLGYSFSTALKTTAKADLAGAEGDNNWGAGFENYEDDISFDAKVKYKDFDFGLVYQDKKTSNTTFTKTVGTSRLDNGPFWQIHFLNFWAKHKYVLNDKAILKSQLYYRDTTVPDDTTPTIISPMPPPGERHRWYRPGEMYGLEEQLSYQFSDQFNLTGGIVFEHERLADAFSKTTSGFNSIPPSPPEPNSVNTDLTSLYLQAQYKLTEQLETTLGIRYDDSNYYGEVTTPRVALVYNKDNFVAKLLYSEAFRAPKPWDFTFGVGNPALESEEMRSNEVYMGYFYSENTQAELSLYANYISGILVKDGSGTYFINQGELNVHGAEITLSHKNKNLKSYINYTFNDSYDENGNEMPEISKHMMNLGGTYYFSDHLQFDLSANYLGERKNTKVIPATGNDMIDDALILNANLLYRHHSGWDFSFIVKNILDKEYYHSSNLQPERYRQPQRTFLLKLQYKFQ